MDYRQGILSNLTISTEHNGTIIILDGIMSVIASMTIYILCKSVLVCTLAYTVSERNIKKKERSGSARNNALPVRVQQCMGLVAVKFNVHDVFTDIHNDLTRTLKYILRDLYSNNEYSTSVIMPDTIISFNKTGKFLFVYST